MKKNSTTRKNSKTKTNPLKKKMAKTEDTLNEYEELGDALDLDEDL
jgi:hypothetical protein